MPALVDKEIRCPFCRTSLSIYQRTCPECAGDLSLLSDLNLLPYALFNQGLELFANGDFGGALVKFAAAVEWAPTFAEAHSMLARAAESVSLPELAATHRRLAES
jgi:hypothetical protein